MALKIKTTKILLKDLKDTNKLQNFNFISERDPLYQSIWMNKFLSTTLITQGKKQKGEILLYTVLRVLKKIYMGHDSFPIIFESVEKMKSALETRPLRLGGNIVSVPLYIIGVRRIKLVLLKYRQAFWKRNESKAVMRIVKEIVTVLRNPKDSYLGQLDNKSWDVIYNNRSYIHYRWY